MIFTNDDLKRLKDAVAIIGDTKQTFCADFKIKALLNRLKAAEVALVQYRDFVMGEYYGGSDLYKAWLKSMGK